MSDWGEPHTKTVAWHDPAIARAAAGKLVGHATTSLVLLGPAQPE